jgi:hypothetical protein
MSCGQVAGRGRPERALWGSNLQQGFRGSPTSTTTIGGCPTSSEFSWNWRADSLRKDSFPLCRAASIMCGLGQPVYLSHCQRIY